jgi:hypothetical protein
MFDLTSVNIALPLHLISTTVDHKNNNLNIMNVRCFFKFAFCWSHNENFENYSTQQQKISLRPNKKICVVLVTLPTLKIFLPFCNKAKKKNICVRCILLPMQAMPIITKIERLIPIHQRELYLIHFHVIVFASVFRVLWFPP